MFSQARLTFVRTQYAAAAEARDVMCNFSLPNSKTGRYDPKIRSEALKTSSNPKRLYEATFVYYPQVQI